MIGLGSLAYDWDEILRTDLAYWVINGIMWIVILAPQVVVLTAFVRVCRLNNERRRVESPTERAEVSAFQNIGSPTRTTSPTSPGDPPRSEHVCLLPLSVDIPETSSQEDSEDLPPSYDMAVLQSSKE